ncbi:DUF2291 family protein [Salinispira pacifica]
MTMTFDRRMLVRVGVPVLIVVLLVVLYFAGALATVKPIADAKSVTALAEGGTAFDKVKYVDSIWDSKVIPTVEKDAVEFDTLFAAIQADPKKAAEQYGHDVGGATNYLVSFSGTVGNVDTSSLTGTISVNVPYKGTEVPVKVQIGPIILGTALRDAVKFIKFEQFLNQMQFGNVSDELNSRVEKDVVSKLDLKSLPGKKISIKGAFTYEGSSNKDILVTPVIVKVE